MASPDKLDDVEDTSLAADEDRDEGMGVVSRRDDEATVRFMGNLDCTDDSFAKLSSSSTWGTVLLDVLQASNIRANFDHFAKIKLNWYDTRSLPKRNS